MLKKGLFSLVFALFVLVKGPVFSVQAQNGGNIQFRSSGERWGESQVAVLNAAKEPEIVLNSYQVSGTGTFVLRQVNQADVLNHLIYKYVADGNWGDATIDQVVAFNKDKYPVLATFEQQVENSGTNWQNSFDTTIKLPISGTGVWYLEGTVGGRTTETMIVRSNLSALIHKGDNQNIYWVQDTSYQSVPDASIQLFNSENSLTTLKEIHTDQDGLAKDVPNDALDFALVSKGNDYTIIPVNLSSLNYRSTGSSYFYSSFSQRTPSTKSFIFTDRFLYKPGDTVNFKAIIRQDDDADYRIVPKTYRVSLGGGDKPVWEQEMSLSELGALDGSIKLPDDFEAEYLSLDVTTDGSYETSTSIQVARFRKPDAILTASTDKMMYLPGEKVSTKIEGSLFLGQPIRNQEVRYKVYQTDATGRAVGDFTQVKFTQGLDGYQTSQAPLYEGKLTFDTKGQAQLELPAVNKTGFRQFWQFHFEYLDAAGTATNEAVQILMQPGDFVIETAKEQPRFVTASEQYFPLELKKNKIDAELARVKIKARLLVSNGSGYTLVQDGITATTDQIGHAAVPFTPTANTNYKLEFEADDKSGNTIRAEEVFYVYDKNDKNNNPEEIFTITQDKNTYEVGDTAKITITTKPEVKTVFVSLGRVYSRDYRVLPVQNGHASFEFLVLEKYQPNIFIQATSFWGDEIRQQEEKVVVNTEDKHVTVKITPDKLVYGPAETAVFTLEATDGKGRPVQTDLAFWIFDKSLLELHGTYFSGIFERFWDERWFSIPTNYSYQGISGSGAEGGGGCFSGETLVTMADGSYKRIDQVVAGDEITTFADSASQELVSTTVNKAYSVKVAGYLVINGTLKITPEHKLLVNDRWITAGEMKMGDVIRLSNGQTQTITSIEWVRGAFTVYNLHVDKYHTFFANDVYVHNDKGGARSIFKDTAYWNPSIRTDASGKAQVTVVLPDNLTTWVTAAVAASTKTEVGIGQGEFKVTKEVVVRPIFPLFLRAGDQISLAALVQNFTTKAHDFLVSAKFSGGKIADAEQSIKVEAEDLEELVWPIEVGEAAVGAPTTTTFQVKAVSKNDSSFIDDVTEKMPIYEYGSPQTSYQKGASNNGDQAVSLPITLADGTDTDRASAELTLTTTKFPGLEKDIEDLLAGSSGGPQSAAEALLAAAVVYEHGSELGLTGITRETARLGAEKANQTLTNSQELSGFWQSHDGRIDYLTTRLAIESMVVAEQAGLAINQPTLSKAISYFASQKPTLWSDKVEQQYIFSLFKEGQYAREKLDLSNSYDPELLARAVIANSRQGFVNSTEEVQVLLQLAKETPTQMAWLQDGYDRWWGHISVPTTWSARALIELDAELDKADKALSYVYRNNEQHWRQPSAILLLTTLEFYQKTNQLAPNYSYQVLVDGEVITSGSVTSANQKIKPVALTATQLGAASQLQITQTGTGRLFSTLAQTEFYTTRELAAKNNNLQVERRYLSTKAEGEPTKVGDLVLVEFTVTGLGSGERFVNITDYVPSGLVVIDESLNNGNFDQNTHNDNWTTQEITDQGMKLQFSRLFSDNGTFSYKTRVVSEGVFDAPPTVVSLSGDQSIWGSSSADRLVIDGKNVLEKVRSNDQPRTERTSSSKRSLIKRVLLVAVPAAAVAVGAIGYWQRLALWELVQKYKTRFGR